jgi:uncharacterized protein
VLLAAARTFTSLLKGNLMKGADHMLHPTFIQLNDVYKMYIIEKGIATMSKFGLFVTAALVLAPVVAIAKSSVPTEHVVLSAMNLQRGGDTANAIATILPLAQKGDAMAQNALGVLYLGEEDGGINPNPDFAAAFKWISKAAAQRFAPAEGNLGNLYASGHGVPKDAKKAVRWYQLATGHGDVEGQYNLARAYQLGAGVTKNPAKAIALYAQSIDLGYLKSFHNLGIMHLNGDGIPIDLAEAQRLFQAASDKGHAPSTTALGKLYYGHTDNAADQAKGVALFRLAAQRGQSQGAFNVGVAYREGVGIAKDPIKSAVWFSIASDMGDPDALAEAKRIGGNFSPADRTAAQAFIKICGETKLETCG